MDAGAFVGEAVAGASAGAVADVAGGVADGLAAAGIGCASAAPSRAATAMPKSVQMARLISAEDSLTNAETLA